MADYYPNKIQRMWFYGIVDFDNDLKLSMKEDNWSNLYSKGTVYYKDLSIYTDVDNPNEQAILVPTTLMSYDAVWKDAKARNEVFLSILRNALNGDRLSNIKSTDENVLEPTNTASEK